MCSNTNAKQHKYNKIIMCSAKFRWLLLLIIDTILWIEGSDGQLSSDSFRSYQRLLQGTPPNRTSTLNDTRLIIYGDESNNTSYLIGDIENLRKDPNLDPNRPTVIYGHGWLEISTDESVTTMVNAYQKHGGYNIIAVDWANLSFGNYVHVAGQIKALGAEVGKAIVELLKGPISIKSLHLIGHSLGVHLMAATARMLKMNDFDPLRLTGLDPALPGFYPSLLGEPVAPEDAAFVDIIHTDGGSNGVLTSTGHADFYPNGGTPTQPGCHTFSVPLSLESFCSHWRSWRFYAESVNGGEFFARSCENNTQFKQNDCKDGELVLMGYAASPDLRGSFYLRTTSSKPYALGKAGADSM